MFRIMKQIVSSIYTIKNQPLNNSIIANHIDIKPLIICKI